MRHRLSESDPVGWILGVADSTDFVDRHLGSSWHHATCDDRDRFAQLLSLTELDEILGTYGIRHPDIKLVKLEEEIPRSEYLWRDDLVDPLQVGRLFAAGATVIFGALHDRHEGLRRLCSATTRQVGARTQTNIYLTPPSSQGFRPHWDTHDVFVLQVEGGKRWRIYGGGPHRPTRDQKFHPEQHDVGEVEAELTLRAGEVLYIPRGIMHAAETTDEISLHITLGVMSYTWADLLSDCLSELVERSPELRANVPFGLGRGAEEGAVEREVAELVARLPAEIDLTRVLRERRDAFASFLRPRATDALRQATAAGAVASDDTIEWRSGLAGRVERRNGRVVLRTASREVDFPAAASDALEAVVDAGPILAGDVEDGLDWESRRVVLSTLIREGLIARIPDPASPSTPEENR